MIVIYFTELGSDSGNDYYPYFFPFSLILDFQVQKMSKQLRNILLVWTLDVCQSFLNLGLYYYFVVFV